MDATKHRRYDSTNVDIPYRPHFEALQVGLPEFELWEERQNFDRWLSAVVFDPKTGASVAVWVHDAIRERHAPISDVELIHIRSILKGAGSPR